MDIDTLTQIFIIVVVVLLAFIVVQYCELKDFKKIAVKIIGERRARAIYLCCYDFYYDNLSLWETINAYINDLKDDIECLRKEKSNLIMKHHETECALKNDNEKMSILNDDKIDKYEENILLSLLSTSEKRNFKKARIELVIGYRENLKQTEINISENNDTFALIYDLHDGRKYIKYIDMKYFDLLDIEEVKDVIDMEKCTNKRTTDINELFVKLVNNALTIKEVD